MDEKRAEISHRARKEVEARTAEAVDAHGAVSRELERRRGDPPRPGDLYVVELTAEQPLEWLVLEAVSTGQNRWLVVPADTQQLVGSADVAVADDEPGGPLALRCGHATEIEAVHLGAEMRTGSVGEATLDRVLDKRRQITIGQLSASTEQVETDADPEYVLWIDDVVAPARAALEAVDRSRLRLVSDMAEDHQAAPVEAPTEAPTKASVATIPSRRRWRRATAAALPLAACLAWLLAGMPGWHHDPEIATLMLVAGARTGGEPTLGLAPDTETVELRVDLGADDDYQSFRAILTTLAGVEVWRAADLPLNASDWGSEVVVSLAAELLPNGDYELALEGIGTDGEVSEVGFYSFQVMSPP